MEDERAPYDLTTEDSESWAEMELPPSVFPQEDEEQDSYADHEGETRAPLELGFSPLALRGALNSRNPLRPAPWLDSVYGLVVHTAGGCIPAFARAAKQRPDLYAVEFYLKSGGTHYVNGWAGLGGQQLHQVMNERHVAWGVGFEEQEKSIAAGQFDTALPKRLAELWHARWPGHKDSSSLLPVRGRPNSVYIHVECVPCLHSQDVIKDKGRVTCGGPYVKAPEAPAMRPGLHFTRAQHDTVIRLAADIAQRHGWPRDTAWWRTPRLLGHEDLTPLLRFNQGDLGGAYDPGALRDKPMFDWNYVYEGLERLQKAGAASPVPPKAVASMVSSVRGLLGSAAERFRQMVRAGQEILAITEAIRSGQTDINQLANLVFYARHPELKARRLRPEERALAQEWLDLRDHRVQPLVARLSP